ncbi:putative mitogen-activated protein kinase kinase kinase STE-STE11 family [Helianthus annuus]|nr:putative mitogen-activated protein kinase kinase kinase STE-STE11 family [Helianthus annuus]
MLLTRSRERNKPSMKLYSRQKQRVAPRRLERRNAIKNIDYDASTSPSSSFDDQFDDQSAHRTRSLDISTLSDRTSFRIEGTEGEFDAICRRLGLSGPDDFAISTADWEKRRSYSPTGGSFPSTSRFNYNNNNLVANRDSTEINLSASFESKVSFSDDEVKSDGEDARVSGMDDVVKHGEEVRVCRIDEERVGVGNECLEVRNGGGLGARVLEDGGEDEVEKARERRRVESGSGIKGVRPPLLAPPPAMSRVTVDNMGSTWDLVRSFAPREDDDDDDLGSDGAGDTNVETSGMMTSRIDKTVSTSDEDLASDGPDDANVETSEMMELRTDTAVSPSGSDRFGDEDEGASVVAVDVEGSLLTNGSIRRGFKNWQKGDYLGSGSFGTVYEGFDEHGTFFAVKEVSLLDSGDQGKQSIFQLEQEISLLSQFHHENIVRYLGTDTDAGKLYIFLELVTKGSLARLYQKYELRDSQVSAYTRQILSGLNYLHERKVVHRDIKCANILVDANGFVKLADFGLAKATALNDIKSCKGTPYWMAPEVVNNRSKKGYGLAADIWSLGCTVLEMLTRQIPYSHLEGMQALFRIGRGEPPPIPDTLSTEARDFILKCLQVNPNDRPTAAQLLDHPFVRRRTSMNLGIVSPDYNPTQL